MKINVMKMQYFAFLPTIDYYKGTIWLGWMNWAIEIGRGEFTEYDDD